MKPIVRVDTVAAFHELLGLPPPQHPMLSVVPAADLPARLPALPHRYAFGLYIVGLKGAVAGGFGYGRTTYDFQEGTLVFTAPGQVLAGHDPEADTPTSGPPGGRSGWTIVMHPDFPRGLPLAEALPTFSFFDYDTREALHLSERERATLGHFVDNVATELASHLDPHSRRLIAVNLESLLRYSARYYDRQFVTRAHEHGDHVARFERFLRQRFDSAELAERGVPTVAECGEALHMSGHDLSDLLRAETGSSARNHIQRHLVRRAKDRLLASNAPVSQVAFELGFEYPQHFSKLFKDKTGHTPTAYRSLN